MTDMISDNFNIDILDIRNISVLTDIFNKHFDPDKHVPILYLVLDINTLNDNNEIDVKLLMLEIEKPVDKNKKQLKRQYLKEKLKLNINNLLMYTEFIQNLVE